MHYLKSLTILFLLSTITLISCKQDSTNTSEAEQSKSVTAKQSDEFKTYYDLFFKLSDENTKTDLTYVNNFLKDNKLIPFNDICELIENEKVKSDTLVFKYWNLRCDFQTVRNSIFEKYKIDSDSLSILIKEAVIEQQ